MSVKARIQDPGLTQGVTLAQKRMIMCLSLTLHHTNWRRAKSAFYVAMRELISGS
jgi:hypothetical protein